jgi:hypothetical protein
MNTPKLEKVRKCCGNSKSHLIFYDGADTADLPVLVCEKCIKNPVFQKFILLRFKITKKTDVKQLLKDYLED